MTRPYLIAKLILTAMGVYVLVRFIGAAGSIFLRFGPKFTPENSSMIIFIITAELIILIVVSLILLFRSDDLARIITGPGDDLCDKVNVHSIIAAFRLTACFCGLLLVNSCIARLFYYIPAIFKGPILSYTTLQGQMSQISPRLLTGALEGIAYLILAAYLISGAAHYVRWQISKIAINKSSQKEGIG
jgi:hypothetical protein